MTIAFDEKKRIFHLDTERTSYQMKVGRYGHLLHLYYGRRTARSMDGHLVLLDRGFSGNPYDAGMDRTYSMDALPQEFPTQGTGDYRSPLLAVTDARGLFGCDLRYDGYQIRDGYYELPGLPALHAKDGAACVATPGPGEDPTGPQTLEIRLVCEDPALEVRLLYGVLPQLDIITRSAVIRNTAPADAGTAGDLVLEKAQTACLDFTRAAILGEETCRPARRGEGFDIDEDLQAGLDRIIFRGRHAMERIPDRQSVGHGSYVIGSRRGFSSHQYNPFLILCDRDADEEHGRCWSMQFVYSGGFKAEVEQDQYGQIRMQMGLMEEGFAWRLAPGEQLVLPQVIMSFSGKGLERLSQNHHACIREHICRAPKNAPESVRESVPESIPESAPESIPESAPESVPESVPESIPESAPESILEKKGFAPPVLLNSWEACYFDFNGNKILQMAEEAKGLGIDMIVLDDGWFGERNDDLRALGDWFPNEEKLGCSLGELSRRIHSMGMQFGIWMEPEMVSEDSQLYREHPDWALRIPGRDPVRARYQLVLDLSRPEVGDEIFRRICAVLDSARIEYLKWDANRHLADLYSVEPAETGKTFRAEGTIGSEGTAGAVKLTGTGMTAGSGGLDDAVKPTGAGMTTGSGGLAGSGQLEGNSATAVYRIKPAGMIQHQYVLGLYRLLERLRKRYPQLLIEGCCGGGGRFDAGMLYYTPQIWCSDNTDPIDRLAIQYGTSFGYPVCTMGAHVSASPNELTGRSTPLQTRGAVAMAGTFGYELDPSKLTKEEKEEIRGQIRAFREDASLIRTGNYYRLSDPCSDQTAWMIVSEDRRQAIVISVRTGQPLHEVKRLRLRGLLPQATYRIEETSAKAAGSDWMEQGIELPAGNGGPYQSFVFHLAQCAD